MPVGAVKLPLGAIEVGVKPTAVEPQAEQGLNPASLFCFRKLSSH